MLSISDNKRYFIKNGKPFFWLADTAWLMFTRLEIEDIELYFKNRHEKGYNVIFCSMIHELTMFKDEQTFDLNHKDYWNKIAIVIELAKKYDLYMALLPAWGSIVKEGIVNLDNIEIYSHFIGDKYQKYDNVIWVLGGDVRGAGLERIYEKEAEILKSYNPDRLMTYHPFGRTRSSMWFHGCDWLDFNTFQSGHRRYDQQQLGEWDDAIANETYFGEDNWQYVEHDRVLEPIKPTLDAEPSYEGIPKGLHNPHCTYWEAWDVRRYAYWSVFAGAAGHTYGSNAVMQFHQDMSKPGSFTVRETWKEAIHHPGSGQMQHLKQLFEAVSYQEGQEANHMLIYGQKERYHRISVFAGDGFIYCYTYLGDQFMLDLSNYQEKVLEAYWMNPEDGTYSYVGKVQNQVKHFVSPIRRQGASNDWVYVLKVMHSL